ncbi:DMT family transporter [Aphanizomenon sp. UHCC 0183]|jgi:drug/metabolite transporter (DMT)-like permease|uniref:DMT family transporter n=1 Tax=Aphanizomenon sp. UHCC 0183 TaxID=2590028 RepID=UPI0014488E07|nr:DMT family transporter [Aphanizomenon sp. UHCC 0183]MTJ31249.1 DMT family transporter [Aphanizomenon sp. UHCC 0183]
MTHTENLSNEVKLEKTVIKEERQLPITAAILSLFIALFALSLAAIFIRLSEVELGSNATIFNRMWIATICFGVWNSFKQIQFHRLKDSNITAVDSHNSSWQQNLGLILLMGIVSSISVILWAWSLTQTSVANSTLLRNLTPVFTTLFGWLFLKQSFDITFLIGMAIALVGVITISITDFSYSINNITGDVAALFAAVFYSIYILIVKQLRARLSSSTILLWRCFIGTVFTLPIVFLTEQQVFPHSYSGWLAVISLSLVCQVLGQGLVAQSLNQLSPGFVATTLLFEPAITAIIAWVIFSEQLSLLNWLAFCVILIGIYLAKPNQTTVKTNEVND